MNEIAYAWGFSDPTHIGRRFKKMYGRLPSEVRKPENAGSASNLRNALMRKTGSSNRQRYLSRRGYAVTRTMESAQTAILAVILHDLVSEDHVVP